MIRSQLVLALVVFAASSMPSLAQGNKGGKGGGGGGGGGGKDDGPVFACPQDADFDAFAFVIHDGTDDYVAGFGMDLGAGTLTGVSQSFDVEAPQALTVHPSLPVLYVVDRSGGPIYVYDIALGGDGCPVIDGPTIVSNVIGGGSDIEVHPDGQHLYVSGRGDGDGGLAVFSLEDGAILAGTPYLAGEPFMRLDIAPLGEDVYLAADTIAAPQACGDPSSVTCPGADSIVRQPLSDGVPSGEAARFVVSHDGGSVVGDQRVRGVVADDDQVFVAAFLSNTIWSCGRDLTACFGTSLDPGILAPWGLALDAANLYVGSNGEFSKGKVRGEGVSVLDPELMSAPPEPLEGAGAARNLIRFDHVSGAFLLAADFGGSLSLFEVSGSGLIELAVAVDTGDGNAREVAVISVDRLPSSP